MKTTLISLLFVAFIVAPEWAHARVADATVHPAKGQLQGAPEPRNRDDRITQSNGMSLSQAIASVRSRTNGKIIDAKTRVEGGREVHYIKVLEGNGKVKTHKINGRRR
jgi:uncharacterized membrane protein YkoI